MDQYEKYKLQWMLDHGYSISDLIAELTEEQYSDPEDSDAISRTVDEIFEDWERDRGFSGEIWACKSEWKECEGIEQK